MAYTFPPGYAGLIDGSTLNAAINAAKLPVVGSVTTTSATTILPSNVDVLDVHVTRDSTLLMANGFDGQEITVRFWSVTGPWSLIPPINWGVSGIGSVNNPYQPNFPSSNTFDSFQFIFIAAVGFWYIQVFSVGNGIS